MTGVPRIFLESERMILRQFTTDDADLLFRLDNDADVMLYVNGGIPVPLEEIVLDLAWFLSYYERFDGYGFWAAMDKTTGGFWAGSISDRTRVQGRWNPSWAIACTDSRGIRVTRPKVHGRLSVRASPSWASNA